MLMLMLIVMTLMMMMIWSAEVCCRLLLRVAMTKVTRGQRSNVAGRGKVAVADSVFYVLI